MFDTQKHNMVPHHTKYKLLTMQKTMLKTIIVSSVDTNIQHLYSETQILPLNTHLKLHASQLRQKTQHTEHSLYNLTIQTHHRLMKPTICHNYTTSLDTLPENTTVEFIRHSPNKSTH